MNKKRIVLIVVWFFLVLCVAMILIGCVTKPYQRPDCPYGDPLLKPLPPEKLENLLFQEPTKSIAYKSITIKEIIGEKDFN